MTDDITALIAELQAEGFKRAVEALEALQAENERLEADLDEAFGEANTAILALARRQGRYDAAEAERDALQARIDAALAEHRPVRLRYRVSDKGDVSEIVACSCTGDARGRTDGDEIPAPVYLVKWPCPTACILSEPEAPEFGRTAELSRAEEPLLAWDDDQSEVEMCACCYGEPYDPHECDGQPDA